MLAILKLSIGWFAEVLSEYPHDISSSRYFASVVNVHKQGWEVLELMQPLANDHFEMLSRWGFYWSSALSAVVCHFVSFRHV